MEIARKHERDAERRGGRREVPPFQVVENGLYFRIKGALGLPDPPTHVQVEVGPQPGTLLVSWKSVTNQPKPPSRAAVHSYLIYADGKNIAQVPNETADHVLLRLADLSDDPPIFITVRTKTKEGAVSSDSNVARVPRTPYNQGVPGPIVENPLLLSQSQQPPASLQQPQLIDMTSSYPSYTTANPTGIYGQTMVPSAPNLMLNGHLPTAPYTAPSRLVGATGMMTSYQQPTSAVVQPFATVPPPPTQQSHPPATSYSIYDRSVQPNKAQLLMSQPSIAKIPAQMPPAWKTSQMSQYYTFHPSFLHTEPSGPEENRPSVLEMENSYLMRHRQSEWANAPDARARIEAYARGIGRAGSADERSAGPRHRLVPPRLARVKSESGFGTRSEPDLRPPTLDDDCRWFVALFDYSHHMSPNANAETEELSFRKHQLIKVFGDVDPDGFYTGQIGSRVGLVPSNMVIEIAKDDLAPRRTVTAAAAEPTLRRMRWGSLKSRSYDHAGDRVSHHRAQQNYASLDRRDDRPERSERHRRTNGRADYDYSRRDHDRDRDYDDRYMRDREASREPRDRRERDMRDDYRSRDRDYRDRDDEEYGRDRYRDRDRDRDHRERDRGYDDRMRRPEAAYSRDRDPYAPESGFRRDRSQQPRGDEAYREDPARTVYDYPPGAQGRYEPQIPGSSNQMHQNPSQMNQMNQLSNQMGQMQMGGPYPTQQPQQQQPQGLGSSSALGGMGGAGMMPTVPAEGTFNGLPVRKMVAKFDYDSRQLSPNVDAEQVELSFRQGDVIVVYGEMDEDGFYMGELNGLRGLVPSNFLQSSPLTTLGPSQPTEPMRKGVAFSDMTAVRRNAPVRQTSQTSTGAASGSTTAAAKPAAKKSTAGQSAKPLTKKTSDVGKNSVPNARKTSTAVKKSDSTAKKK
ncbi:unnamed protein product [Caenorhabditis auriculariae]|uniref:Uncharacterized protein n=1 Tax=Caenorhabditis auriculariae TaxID=2777116 RepID=A0A8S1HTJ9_9PELO|nr:unnamed protein product [Caenorhabditis auriculariae]